MKSATNVGRSAMNARQTRAVAEIAIERNLFIWVTFQNISYGDQRLHLVLRTQFLRWRSGLRCFIFLGARAHFLPVFRPAVFAPYFSFIFAVWVGADCIWFEVLLWGAYLLDSLPLMLTLSLVGIPPSVPACWRTTYYPIEACTFNSPHFHRVVSCGFQNLPHKCSNNAEVAPRSKETLRLCRVHDIPSYANMKQHSVPSTATLPVLCATQHRVHTRRRCTTESGRCEGGAGEAIAWGCSSWDTSARIFDTFSSLYKASTSRFLSMLSLPSVFSWMDAWQYYQN